MSDADRLREMKPTSTDPDRFEREARMAEAREPAQITVVSVDYATVSVDKIGDGVAEWLLFVLERCSVRYIDDRVADLLIFGRMQMPDGSIAHMADIPLPRA